MEYRYIIKGEGTMAMPVQSDLDWMEFKDHIQRQTKKLHPKSHDTVWCWGTTEFINPKVMSVDDFANFCPAIIGVK
jgi:hypothetical protein